MALRDPEQEKILSELAKKKSVRKFRNIPTKCDGFVFDSKAEAERWKILKLLQKAGEISKLRRQVTYKLYVNGILICKYKPDFRYRDRDGNLVCEDVKSAATRTRAYRIKWKLMKAIFGIEVVEIEK